MVRASSAPERSSPSSPPSVAPSPPLKNQRDSDLPFKSRFCLCYRFGFHLYSQDSCIGFGVAYLLARMGAEASQVSREHHPLCKQSVPPAQRNSKSRNPSFSRTALPAPGCIEALYLAFNRMTVPNFWKTLVAIRCSKMFQSAEKASSRLFEASTKTIWDLDRTCQHVLKRSSSPQFPEISPAGQKGGQGLADFPSFYRCLGWGDVAQVPDRAEDKLRRAQGKSCEWAVPQSQKPHIWLVCS